MGLLSECSSFDLVASGTGEARRGMWAWAEPIIMDRAIEAYGGAADASVTGAMALEHCKLWSGMIQEGPAGLPIKDALHRAADGFGLERDVVDEVDDLILEELVDVVTSRFRASRNTTKALSLILMSATAHLGTARLAA